MNKIKANIRRIYDFVEEAKDWSNIQLVTYYWLRFDNLSHISEIRERGTDPENIRRLSQVVRKEKGIVSSKRGQKLREEKTKQILTNVMPEVNYL